jgi:HAD superfamily hydrolase (TIGR01484 family)
LHDATYLLASDLDGTLIPPAGVEDDGGIAELRDALEERGGMLAYVTGRHLSLALDGIERHALREPDVLVCDVGTSVYFRRGDRYEPDPLYRARMLTALGAADPASLRRELSSVQGLTPQEPERQAEFKLSYYAPVGPEGEDVALRAETRLAQVGGLVNVVYSEDAVAGNGLVDVLPAGVAKDTAVRYLHDRSGVPEQRLVYAGDSGNDRAAMLSGFNVVVVGNADEGFREAIRREAEELDIGARVYLAERPFADGVLEGCRHFGIL